MNLSIKQLILPIIAMAIILVISNMLVPVLINDWLSWGTLTFPFAFLVTDLTNRHFGAAAARKLIYVGFVIGILVSWILADERIAMASGAAFLISQLIDVSIFDRLRQTRWWIAPLASSVFSTVLDTFLFWFLAFGCIWYFGCTDVPWTQLATTDLMVKWVVALAALLPYRLLTSNQPASA